MANVGMLRPRLLGTKYSVITHCLVEPVSRYLQIAYTSQLVYSTFYESSTYPESVIKRLPHGYFENEGAAYQPRCKETWNAPIIGRDMRNCSVSWMQSAGGAVSSARDVDRWMRAVFGGKVVPPKQQQEWIELVSTRTGEPIATVSANDPGGFALGLAYKILEPLGAQWFYEGESLGYRPLYVWIADQDLMITVQTNSRNALNSCQKSAVAALTFSNTSRYLHLISAPHSC